MASKATTRLLEVAAIKLDNWDVPDPISMTFLPKPISTIMFLRTRVVFLHSINFALFSLPW